ncbi:MgtC/SapB family protein [Acetobacter fallax]|uniref:Protein MgtC n=1 Tax=Acetobacter fallax TaxID=1737473 RepID=A0ABX0KJQ2_9PROT|nr:MgtC/SapB family protein [Acetobacter fallax]NHO34112.1 MgtC/SapB family protein [Acetobacter fallax]NHO37646.1 MgtC/SapB family protein [Acetobacter fallax]
MHVTTFPGEGWQQLGDLTLAFVLSGLVGLEREFRQKSAGLRTYTLVGMSAALFMLISKFGFNDVLASGQVVLDPSRVAAQVVSGIGFIGGGVIFMRRDVVRGLTTAASVWFTAALGMACGAGLLELAVATTAAHFLIMFVFPRLTRNIPQQRRTAAQIAVSYIDGKGVLRRILVECTRLRFAIDHVSINRNGFYEEALETAQDRADLEGTAGPLDHPHQKSLPNVTLSMQVKGKRPVSHLIAALATLEGVQDIGMAEDDED